MALATFAGGVAAGFSYGSWDRVSFSSGAWTAGSTWTLAGTVAQGDFTFGMGYLTADHTSGNYITALSFNKRVFIGMKDRVVFCAINEPRGWNVQDTGAGFFLVQNQQGQQDVVNGLASFQGRLAVLGRYNIQIWTINADPTLFQWGQTLSNIGTNFPRSVQGLGELDVLFADDSGIRSLRTLVTTLNATVYDIGAPLDAIVQLGLRTGTNNISIVEPSSKRFWIAIEQTIYVLSYYPQLKIQAWGSYACTDSLAAAFTPTDFISYRGLVLVRGDNNKIYVYGGPTTTPTYDASVVTVQLPWLHDKRPNVYKAAQAFGAVLQGKWSIKIAMDPQSGFPANATWNSGSASAPNSLTDSTYDIGRVAYTENGTHFSILATSADTSTTVPALFCAAAFHYNIGNTL